MIIAIDGPAASGKGTLARNLAKHYDFAYLDTGSLYRTVGLMVMQAGKSPSDTEAAIIASTKLDRGLFGDPKLRDEATGDAASIVSQVPEVRANLLNFQREFSSAPPDNKKGAVIDGRDIGTVVCPDAEVKFFVTASPEVRAKRRTKEILNRGEAANYEEILSDVRARDARDTERKNSPLRPAENAHLLDTSKLDIDAVLLRAIAIINKSL